MKTFAEVLVLREMQTHAKTMSYHFIILTLLESGKRREKCQVWEQRNPYSLLVAA